MKEKLDPLLIFTTCSAFIVETDEGVSIETHG